MRGWLRARRRLWEESFDRSRILEQSHPRSLLVVLGVGLACILVPAYVEPIASSARMDHVWLPVSAWVLGVLASVSFWAVKGSGWRGLALTFFDTVLLVTSVALCVALSEPPISYGYAALFGLMLASVQAREYALTLPFAMACVVPTVLVSALAGVGPMEALLLGIGCVVALWLSYNTRRMRAIERQRDRLVTALQVSDAVADAGVDLGLAGVLLDLGNFMHELRNAQSGVELNLQYLREFGQLQGDAADALVDASAGHERAMRLARGVLDDIQRKGRAATRCFRLDEALRRGVGKSNGDIAVHLEEPLVAVFVRGDPAHVDEVLNNLVRNARQAGASSVTVSVRYEPAHTVVCLRVRDDGPGLPADRIGSLFQPFVTLSAKGGSGLGLYLCRRRVELMGGVIEAHNLESGGAAFDIRLPVGQPSSDFDEESHVAREQPRG